jgi:anti-anti-sigma factor
MNFILRPQTDLDINGASILQQTLLTWVETTSIPPQSYWIIDLSQVNAIDRFGLFILAELHRLAVQKQCHLRLCNLNLPVRSMLSAIALKQKFKIWEQTNSPVLPDFQELWVSELFGTLKRRLMENEELRGGKAAISPYAFKEVDFPRDRVG